MKKLLFLTMCFVTGFSGVSPMSEQCVATAQATAQAEEVKLRNFFGGARSAAELQGRIASVFDQYEMVSIPVSFTQSPVRWLGSWFKSWVSSPLYTEQPELVRVGVSDLRLREVEASGKQTQVYIDALKNDPKISDAARDSDIRRSELRQKLLSEVQACHEGFRRDLVRANETVGFHASEIDRIAQIGQDGEVVVSDTDTAKTVNAAMKDPFERAQRCFSHIVTHDSLVEPQVNLGIEMVRDGAQPYVESERLVQQAADELEQKAAQERIRLKREELTERCKLSGGSFDCWIDSSKLAASEMWGWTTNGWSSLGERLEQIPSSAMIDSCNRAYETVRDCGVYSDQNGLVYGGVQGFKVCSTAALAAVGSVIAYKLIKFGWNHGGHALYNALWGNRSKKVKVAILTALGAAVAVAPSTAMHYGLMQP